MTMNITAQPTTLDPSEPTNVELFACLPYFSDFSANECLFSDGNYAEPHCLFPYTWKHIQNPEKCRREYGASRVQPIPVKLLSKCPFIAEAQKQKRVVTSKNRIVQKGTDENDFTTMVPIRCGKLRWDEARYMR